MSKWGIVKNRAVITKIEKKPCPINSRNDYYLTATRLYLRPGALQFVIKFLKTTFSQKYVIIFLGNSFWEGSEDDFYFAKCNDCLKNHKVCFTGDLVDREVCKILVEANGGEYVSQVDSQTTLLVSPCYPESISTKESEAIRHGTKIISYNDFLRLTT